MTAPVDATLAPQPEPVEPEPGEAAAPDPGSEAWSAIAELFLSAVNHTRYHSACTAIGVPPPALKALLALEPGEAKSMRTLANEWQCDASWVTSLVDILESRSLVERRILPTDRRVKTIVLTASGVDAKARALGMLRFAPEAMSALSTDEQCQLRDLLLKLVEATKPPN